MQIENTMTLGEFQSFIEKSVNDIQIKKMFDLTFDQNLDALDEDNKIQFCVVGNRNNAMYSPKMSIFDLSTRTLNKLATNAPREMMDIICPEMIENETHYNKMSYVFNLLFDNKKNLLEDINIIYNPDILFYIFFMGKTSRYRKFSIENKSHTFDKDKEYLKKILSNYTDDQAYELVGMVLDHIKDDIVTKGNRNELSLTLFFSTMGTIWHPDYDILFEYLPSSLSLDIEFFQQTYELFQYNDKYIDFLERILTSLWDNMDSVDKKLLSFTQQNFPRSYKKLLILNGGT